MTDTSAPPQNSVGDTMAQLVAAIIQAKKGDVSSGERLMPILARLAAGDGRTAAMQGLCRALVEVFGGNDEPDLSALPLEAAAVMQGMLVELHNG